MAGSFHVERRDAGSGELSVKIIEKPDAYVSYMDEENLLARNRDRELSFRRVSASELEFRLLYY